MYQFNRSLLQIYAVVTVMMIQMICKGIGGIGMVMSKDISTPNAMLTSIHRLSKNKNKNIGQGNDDMMKRFKPVSSHGREDVFHEDSNSNETNHWYYNLQLYYRAIQHMINFSPVFCTLFFALLSSQFRDFIWYPLVRNALGRSGAAFIKWGQWSSTRPDIFPEELCNALAKLQSHAPEHSYSFTRAAILEEFGEPIEDIFEYFDPKPLASGSIAQVHKAILNGHDVAVKVRHPNVYENIKLDFSIMKAVAEFLDIVPGLKWLNLPESTAQFSGTIASQTKLDIEGRHLVLFNQFFRSWKTVDFPKPYMFTDGVIIESFEYGESVATFATRLAHEYERKIQTKKTDIELAHFIISTGEDLYLKMLIQDNLMHADLHPGNILIQQSLGEVYSSTDLTENKYLESNRYKDKVKNKIVLVDAGMVASLLPEERSNFIGLLEAVGEASGSEAADYVMNFSYKNQYKYSAETREQFKNDMKVFFQKSCRGYGTNVSIGNVLRGILSLVRKHHITIDANYATLVLNALCLDALAQSLLPAYNVMDAAKNLLKLHRFGRVFQGIPWLNRLFLKIGFPAGRWMKNKFDRHLLSKVLKKH